MNRVFVVWAASLTVPLCLIAFTIGKDPTAARQVTIGWYQSLKSAVSLKTEPTPPATQSQTENSLPTIASVQLESLMIDFAPELEGKPAEVLTEGFLAFELKLSRPLTENERIWFESNNHHIAGVLPEDRLGEKHWGSGPLRGGQILGLNPGDAEICAVVITRNGRARDCIRVTVKRRWTSKTQEIPEADTQVSASFLLLFL